MAVAKMGKLPVEHAGQVAPVDQDVAQPQIAVDHARRAWRREVGAQPGKAERDHGAVAAGLCELRGQPFHALGRIEPGQEAERCGVEPVNRGECGGHFIDQFVGSLGENVGRAGGARQAAHDEADAEPVLRRQLGDDFGRGHAAGMGVADQRGFPVHVQWARGEPFGRRRAAQHESLLAMRPGAAEQPAFHVGAARKALRRNDRAAQPRAGHDGPEPGDEIGHGASGFAS